MKDRELNQDESFKLITQMIHNARTNLRAKINSYILLLWGYVTLSIGAIIWVIKVNNLFSNYSFLWLIIPLICYPSSKHFSSKEKISIKSYLDQVVEYFSLLFMVICVLVALASLWTAFPIFYIEGLLISMWIVTIGLLVKYKVIVWGGIFGILISHIILFLPNENYHIPIFSLIIIIAIIIPGHLFKLKIEKHLFY